MLNFSVDSSAIVDDVYLQSSFVWTLEFANIVGQVGGVAARFLNNQTRAVAACFPLTLELDVIYRFIFGN